MYDYFLACGTCLRENTVMGTKRANAHGGYIRNAKLSLDEKAEKGVNETATIS